MTVDQFRRAIWSEEENAVAISLMGDLIDDGLRRYKFEVQTRSRGTIRWLNDLYKDQIQTGQVRCTTHLTSKATEPADSKAKEKFGEGVDSRVRGRFRPSTPPAQRNFVTHKCDRLGSKASSGHSLKKSPKQERGRSG